MTVTGAVKKSLFERLVQSGTDEVDETMETIRFKVLVLLFIIITTETLSSLILGALAERGKTQVQVPRASKVCCGEKFSGPVGK